MKKHFVIANVPTRLPMQSTVLYSFLLHYFNASGVLWGVFITLFTILWIIAIADKYNEIRVDLNATKEEEKKFVKKSKFQERLNELMREEKNK